MELIHCRSESCWVQNAGPPQREGTLPAANPSQTLREGRTMESEALKSHCSQSDTCTWDRNWGSCQPMLGTAQGSESPLPCRGCPEPQRCLTRCDRPCSQHSHSQQGTAATPTLLHCLLLARSSKSGQLHAPSSAFQEKAFLVIIRNTSQHTLPFLKKVSLKGNTQVQKHTATAAPFFRGSQLTGKGRSPSTS